jgi:hypothetical protein
MTYEYWYRNLLNGFEVDPIGVDLLLYNLGVRLGVDLSEEVDIERAELALYYEFSVLLVCRAGSLYGVSSAYSYYNWKMNSLLMWYNIVGKKYGLRAYNAPQIKDTSNRW